jgi:hypothetical protein
MIVTKKPTGSTITWTVDEKITEDQASDIQTQKGYNPAGYGFYSFKTTQTTSTWECSSSCD